MPATTKELIKAIVQQNKPVSLARIRNVLKENKVEVSAEELVSLIHELQSEGVLSLQEQPFPASFHRYLLDSRAWWVYAILFVALAEMLSVIYIPAESTLGTIRMVLGLAMLGLLPGYSSQRALVPRQDLTVLERILLSIFVSVVISITIGVSLGALFLFTPVLNAGSLTAYVLLVTLWAGYRSFITGRKAFLGIVG